MYGEPKKQTHKRSTQQKYLAEDRLWVCKWVSRLFIHARTRSENSGENSKLGHVWYWFMSV